MDDIKRHDVAIRADVGSRRIVREGLDCNQLH